MSTGVVQMVQQKRQMHEEKGTLSEEVNQQLEQEAAVRSNAAHLAR
jgi:hypothetical protein